MVDQNIHFGKPVILGPRICVQDVLELLEAGVSCEQILRNDYPDLIADHIKELPQSFFREGKLALFFR